MDNQFNEISTQELFSFLNKKKIKIIDVRHVNAYNGWKLNKELRGGHIQGAKSLPIKWSNYIDWIEIVRSKGLLPDDTIIIYSNNTGDSKKVAKLFEKATYHNIRIYNHFIDEWSANEEYPMEHLAKYKQLVSPEWVKNLINGKNPPEYNNDKFVICHSHYRNRPDYELDHIPGAIEIDTLTLESPETWNRRTPGELKKTLKEKGITHDTTVVLYGRFSFPNNDDHFPGSSAGHLGAIRCAFIMMYAGVKDVRVLNGGMQSWKDAGFEVTQQETKPVPVTNFGALIPSNPELAVDIPEAKQILKSNDANLVCVRSWNEYIGEVSGYNYIKKKGRIPGAVFGNCGTDAYHMENYRNLDHTTREFHEIEEIWAEVGITSNKHNAFYCGTGWRGSEAFYNAWLMGWPRVSVFDGGWFEWSNDPNNPYETKYPQN
jgi:thiosulfate/3-mercaptopyruvate sulfurtransferase